LLLKDNEREQNFIGGFILIKYSVMYSGSTGNSVYIGTEDYHLLIDAGLSGRKIEAGLKEIGIDPGQINAILLTHEHDDHVKGIGVLSRKYDIPIYGNEKTINHLPNYVGQIKETLIRPFETGTVKAFGDLEIESFAISHDAAEPVGYTIRQQDLKLSIATDLGYVSKKIKQTLEGSDVLIFEANHDVGMLRMSSYPWSVKQRILSDIGHLSNEDAGQALVDIITYNTQKVYLSHLSKENNLQELARLTVKHILEDYGISEDHVKLMDTYPDKPTTLEILEKKKVRGQLHDPLFTIR